ncbi:hypothetical protein [Sporosarcina sp. YIM B06819]|uniref:hypothetical protein n=1 Tax=Sporosarcina sp. YIM B06819 TaxID=3081769 RepID=UPI00298BD190|nr:hypothetical protein [Sporosarcina sp. YIM B06819]
MKKRLIMALIFILAIGGFTLYKIYNDNVIHQSKSIASAVMFESIDDLANSSDLVIKGIISEGFTELDRQLTDKLTTEHIYKFIVTEVVTNNSSDEIIIGDELTISRSISFKQGSSTYNLLEGSSENLETGNYLLFLNQNPLDKTQYTIVSPNHLYKEMRKSKYRNLIGGTAINEIGESEISNLKELTR